MTTVRWLVTFVAGAGIAASACTMDRIEVRPADVGSGSAAELAACSRDSDCQAGLVCKGASYAAHCVVPGKQYATCSTGYCAGNGITSSCSCQVVESLSYYMSSDLSAGCGTPPETNLPAGSVHSTCCTTGQRCDCEFDVWQCTGGGSYCSCSWTKVDQVPTVDLGKCDKSDGALHCCKRKPSARDHVNVESCSCGSLECDADEVEVKSCNAPAAPTCAAGDQVEACRGDTTPACHTYTPPTTTTPADGGTSTDSGGGSSSGSSGGCAKNPSCTSDSDCHDKCKRCDRCSGSCVSRLSC